MKKVFKVLNDNDNDLKELEKYRELVQAVNSYLINDC
jgi:hypothetical protein